MRVGGAVRLQNDFARAEHDGRAQGGVIEHAVDGFCGFLIAVGFLYLWDRIWLRLAGTIGLIAVAITYHGIYNILVSQTGTASMIGYLIPMLTVALTLIFRRRLPKADISG